MSQQSTIAIIHSRVLGCETCGIQSTNCEHDKDDDDDSGNDMVTTFPATPQSRLGVDVTPKACSVTSSTPAVQKSSADTKAVDASGLTFPPGSNNKFCIITLRYGDSGSSHSCHVVPRCTKNNIKLMSKLEYLWCYPRKGMNIDSSCNLVRFGAEFHVSFDCGGWALVPVDHDILSIMQGNYEASFNKYTPTTADPKINFSLEEDIYRGKKSFRYLFLPLAEPQRCKFPIARLQDPLHNLNADLYTFPYLNFPILSLHIFPHFAIWNLGQKFDEQHLDDTYFLKEDIKHLLDYRLALQGALKIYSLWKGFEFSCLPSSSRTIQKAPSDSNRSDSGYNTRSSARLSHPLPPPHDGNAAASSSGGGKNEDGRESMDVGEPEPDAVLPMDSASNVSRTVSSTDLLDEAREDEFMETGNDLFVRVVEWRQGVSDGGHSVDLATHGPHTVLESEQGSETVICALQPKRSGSTEPH